MLEYKATEKFDIGAGYGVMSTTSLRLTMKMAKECLEEINKA